MDSNDLDDLLRQLRSAAGTIRTLYRDLTDEDLDVESAMRHYPLLALGLAAGAGAAAGWWLGRKRQPELPPPPPEPAPKRPLEYVEELLPGAVDRVRARLPEVVLSDAAKTRARAWLGNIVEHQLQQGVDRWADGADTRLGSVFRRATQHVDKEVEVRLEDPDVPGEGKTPSPE